jgi:hypothetical protein
MLSQHEAVSAFEGKKTNDKQSLIFHYVTEPKKFLGDKNHALGILAALKKKCETEDIFFKAIEYPIDEKMTIVESVENLKKSLDSDQAKQSGTTTQHVVLGVGISGLKYLNTILVDGSILKHKPYTIWSGHQKFEELQKLIGKVNAIALPTHVINQAVRQQFRFSNTKIISMVGVPHNVTLEDLSKELLRWQRDKTLQPIPNGKEYIGVILGGDAPDLDGKQRFFTPKEATILAKFVSDLAKKNQAVILVTNGPRTGKFEPETAEECKVHTENAELDKTTAAFEARLFETILKEEGVTYALFNFVFGQPSAYKPILAKLGNTGLAFVTGDSISFVTEMYDVLPKNNIRLIKIGSMNDTHIAYMHSVLERTNSLGYAIDIKKASMEKVVVSPAANMPLYEPAAVAVANQIFEDLNLNASYTEKVAEKPWC